MGNAASGHKLMDAQRKRERELVDRSVTLVSDKKKNLISLRLQLKVTYHDLMISRLLFNIGARVETVCSGAWNGGYTLNLCPPFF